MSASDSSLRTRLAVASVISAAAAGTIYYLYFSNAPAPGSPRLHRSNAVRRHRPNRTTPDEYYPDGGLQGVRNTLLSLADADKYYDGERGEVDPIPIQLSTISNLNNLDDAKVWMREKFGTAYGSTWSDAEWEEFLESLQCGFLFLLLQTEFKARRLEPAEAVEIQNFLQAKQCSESAIAQALYDHDRTFDTLMDAQEQLAILQGVGRETVANSEASQPADEQQISSSGSPEDLQKLLYYIAQWRTKGHRKHRGITCDHCGQRPIVGIRYRCLYCVDFDLCSACEALIEQDAYVHDPTHLFCKIRVPAPHFGYPRPKYQPRPVYPGKPQWMTASMPKELQMKMKKELKFSPEELDGLWEQFTHLANKPWPGDPNGVRWAIDRLAFDETMIPRYSHVKRAPNLLYDRVFSFMDTDGNDLIGCEEFLRALALAWSSSADASKKPGVLKQRRTIAFNGFDINEDGFITRLDCLRLFRAHYAIEREAAQDFIAVNLDHLSAANVSELMNSGQPLASYYPNPDGNQLDATHEPRAIRKDAFGDPLAGEPVLREHESRMDRSQFLALPPTREVTQSGSSGMSPRDRWNRRQFYTDEEEGLERPPRVHRHRLTSREQQIQLRNMDDVNSDEDDMSMTCNPDSPLRSIESSDADTDAEEELSSRASGEIRQSSDTSSWQPFPLSMLSLNGRAPPKQNPQFEAPANTRYEIPGPEKDLGRDIAYQITQQGFNELLDTFFLAIENEELEIEATREERHLLGTVLNVELSARPLFKVAHAGVRQMGDPGEGTFVESYSTHLCNIFDEKQIERLAGEASDRRAISFLTCVDAVDTNYADQYYQEPETPRWSKKHALVTAHRKTALDEIWRAVILVSRQQGKRKSNESYTAYDPTLPQFRPDSTDDSTTDIEPSPVAPEDYIYIDKDPVHNVYMIVAEHFRKYPHSLIQPPPVWRLDRLRYLDALEKHSLKEERPLSSIDLGQFIVKCEHLEALGKPAAYMYFMTDLINTTL